MTVLQSLQEGFDRLQGIERPLCEVMIVKPGFQEKVKEMLQDPEP